jgi:hypothetical protein
VCDTSERRETRRMARPRMRNRRPVTHPTSHRRAATCYESRRCGTASTEYRTVHCASVRLSSRAEPLTCRLSTFRVPLHAVLLALSSLSLHLVRGVRHRGVPCGGPPCGGVPCVLHLEQGGPASYTPAAEPRRKRTSRRGSGCIPRRHRSSPDARRQSQRRRGDGVRVLHELGWTEDAHLRCLWRPAGGGA